MITLLRICIGLSIAIETFQSCLFFWLRSKSDEELDLLEFQWGGPAGWLHRETQWLPRINSTLLTAVILLFALTV